MNILVVDDKNAVQDKVTALLNSRGHSVEIAVNGLDALAKIQKGDYQLFVIDHLMPLMNGVQLTKNIKKMPKFADVPIIFMTTQGSDSLKHLAEFSLFDKVIDKPVNKEEFLGVLTRLTMDCDVQRMTPYHYISY